MLTSLTIQATLPLPQREYRPGKYLFQPRTPNLAAVPPQGLFTLQVLGAAAQLERALIRERTRSGMRAAAARGSRPGNPGLRAGDPAARRRASEARRASYLAGLVAGMDGWLPQVRRLRGDGRPWDEVVRYLNARLAPGARRWTEERLVRAVRRLVREGLAEADLLGAAPPAPPVSRTRRFKPGPSARRAVRLPGGGDAAVHSAAPADALAFHAGWAAVAPDWRLAA